MNESEDQFREEYPDQRLFLVRAKHELLRLHSLWVETNGTEGMRLDLDGADLRKVKMSSVRLDAADLAHSIFWKADLSGSDMRGANTKDCFQGRLFSGWRSASARALSEARKRSLRSLGL